MTPEQLAEIFWDSLERQRVERDSSLPGMRDPAQPFSACHPITRTMWTQAASDTARGFHMTYLDMLKKAKASLESADEAQRGGVDQSYHLRAAEMWTALAHEFREALEFGMRIEKL